MFSFTKEDSELIKGQSQRDPLGTQVVASAMGRHIVPHLTEQTNSVLGFQLLLSVFFFYQKYLTRVDSKFDEIKEGITRRNVLQTFSLENVFILLEQAFAFSYYAAKDDWPLNGKRQVIAFRQTPRLSLKRQILSSQLSTGIWGYYRGAAIRSGLINVAGRHLSESLANAMAEDELHKLLARKKLFDLVTDALQGDGVDFPYRPSDSLIRNFSAILIALPQKKFLRQYLMYPHDNILVQPLAEFALSHKLYDEDSAYWRKFIVLCQKEFPSNSEHFKNIIRCTDYVGSLDWLFEWLMSFNNESIATAAKACPIKIEALQRSKSEFGQISTFPQSTAAIRAKIFLNDIRLDSAKSLISDLIAVHAKIAESRGALKWIRISDSGKIVVEVKPFRKQNDPPDVSPGKGWRYDYYLTPLMNICKGLR